MRSIAEWRRAGRSGEGHGGVEGPGKGDEVHGRLGRAMERVATSREELKRARECCRWSGRVGESQCWRGSWIVVESHGVWKRPG